jgi:hypothetical protein
MGARARTHAIEHHAEGNIEQIVRLLDVAPPPAIVTVPQVV